MNMQQIKVFWLAKEDIRPEPARAWVTNLGHYLRRHAPDLGRDQLIDQAGTDCENDIWSGLPFLLVGDADRVVRYFRNLTGLERKLVDDHAYYWVLTEPTPPAGKDPGDDWDSEGALMELVRQLGLESRNRVIVLDWNARHYNVVWSQIDGLRKHEGLIGLSRSLEQVRSEIDRLALDAKGPSESVLILGESGTGKEQVARSLHRAVRSRRDHPIENVECGWFVETLLQSQLFGHRRGAFNDAVEDRDGLLKTHSEGTLLLNDFDAAPIGVQAALLGYMNTAKGQAGRYFRVGDTRALTSNSWLIFTTNAAIDSLIEKGRIREDFIFRFEDRILYIPPLRERPADLPALALHLWDRVWPMAHPQAGPGRRELRPLVLRFLATRESRWSGNVRALRALLAMAASMARMPMHNADDLRTILSSILDRGPELRNWVSIVTTPHYTGLTSLPVPAFKDPIVAEVVALDRGTDVVKKKGLWPKVRDTDLSGSEARAAAILSEKAKQRLESMFPDKKVPAKTGKAPRQGARLARILVYLSMKKRITQGIAQVLTEAGSWDTAGKDLEFLASAELLEPDGDAFQASDGTFDRSPEDPADQHSDPHSDRTSP
jgi:DNA-binding NtrC family response regulator